MQLLLGEKTSSRLSLHKRIILLFLLLAATSCLTITLVSNYTISKIINTELVSGYENNLLQTRMSLENLISNLNLVTQQLAFDDNTKNQLERYITTKDQYERHDIQAKLYNSVQFASFTNPNIGLCYYYLKPKNMILFNNLPLPNDRTPFQKNHILFQTKAFTYLGPYPSQSNLSHNDVIGLYCLIDHFSFGDIYLYVESNYRSLTELFSGTGTHDKKLLILDKDNNIVFSQLPEVFKVGKSFIKQEGDYTLSKNYYCFFTTTSKGFHIVSLVSKNVYNKERYQWYRSILILIAFLILFSIFLGTIVYKTVYRPLHHFDQQLDYLLLDKKELIVPCTNIPEYDSLISRFIEIESQLKSMISDKIKEEQYRSQLELEKLRYQINPHFLMNTLDTVHWLAITNNQDEIDHMIQSLNHLLAYNLNKNEKEGSLELELSAVKEYLQLQQGRYDFSFSIIKEPVDMNLNYICPKFIFQPLVENALYHGYKDNMKLTIKIEVYDMITISIIDTGIGMNAEQIKKLIDCINLDYSLFMNQSYHRMGIGISYVFQSLKHFYRDEFSYTISSEPNKNTCFKLVLPKERGNQLD